MRSCCKNAYATLSKRQKHKSSLNLEEQLKTDFACSPGVAQDQQWMIFCETYAGTFSLLTGLYFE